ncbi:MAG: hypothetical protein NC489_28970 [Ruminococcus flavefaciens]|nr:hypothetical protein [Ruminococcus flavefaciens]
MKKRILSIVLLAVMLVSLVLPFLVKNSENNEPEIKEVPIVIVTAKPEEDEDKEIVETVNVEKIAIDNFYDEMEYISKIEDTMEWYKNYKRVIEKYSYIVAPPETIYDYFTEDELDLLFHVVQAEVGDERYTFEQKSNVAGVIFSRVEHENFPDTLSEILISGQFSTIDNDRYREVIVTEETILACEYAFQIGSDADDCLFFDSDESLNYKFIMNDEAHNFYTYSNSDEDDWHYLIGDTEEDINNE